MFNYFRKKQLQKKIEKKYGRRANDNDFKLTSRYVKNYHRNRFLKTDDLNLLMFIDIYGFTEEIDNGNGEKLIVNKEFQKTDSFLSDYYYIDHKYTINNMHKDIQDTTIESYSLPLQINSSNSDSSSSYGSSSSSSSYESSSSSSWD